MTPAAPHTAWLLRIAPVFADVLPDILTGLDVQPVKRLGRDFHLVRTGASAETLRASEAAAFVRWMLPVTHSWPCAPGETDGFIEKAAQALVRKFSHACPQTLIAGPLDPSDRYSRTLASNLRGRALQLLPPAASRIRDAAQQDPLAPTLFALLGREGLFCGLSSPRQAGGFHAGGTRFIRQNDPSRISRAGAKLAEALHHITLFRPPPPAGAHWLELGASPGGMTAELLTRNYRVTAVDRAPLDPRIPQTDLLRVVHADAANFTPRHPEPFDALLSDMNGHPLESMRHVTRLASFVRPGGLIVFTVKLPGSGSFHDMIGDLRRTQDAARRAGLEPIAVTHLTYNRHELTLILETTPSPTPQLKEHQPPPRKPRI